MVDRLRVARGEIEEYHRHRLERAERLATMGEVAASLAHEIKNPLAGIAGAIGVMAEELEDGDPRKEIMAEILAQIRRLTKTVQDLLTFARPGVPTLEMCDIHHVIDRVILLLAEDPIAKRVRIVRNYQSGLPRLEADGKQLGQVFLNLLLNAAQAMHGDGQVTITTRLNGADDEKSKGHGSRALEVSLTDTGPGIPPDKLRELFTPFFTTKPRGTGLGLAISRRIVEDHGGWIQAQSPPHQGATFRVGLPVGAPIRRDEEGP
jgi:signal transduction histidine kinase